MNDDDNSVSAHELMCRLRQLAQGYTYREEQLEAAIRKAVIREASVGKVKAVTTEHFDEIARPNDPERIVTMSEQIISETWVPEGEYVLVKATE